MNYVKDIIMSGFCLSIYASGTYLLYHWLMVEEFTKVFGEGAKEVSWPFIMFVFCLAGIIRASIIAINEIEKHYGTNLFSYRRDC